MFGCQETEITKTEKKKKKKTPSLSSFTQEDGVKPNYSNNTNNNNNTKKNTTIQHNKLKILHLFPTHIFNFLFLTFSQQPKKKRDSQINKDPQFFLVPKREKKEKNSKRVGKEG